MKKRVSNNILSVLIIFFIIASFLSTLVIIYYSESLATGKAAAEGTVGVTVGTAPTPSPGPSGGGGGGGGGGEAERIPIIHILDFRIKEIYSVEAFYEDILLTIFTDTRNYTFKIERVIPNKETELSLGISRILIPTDEIVSLDLDRDGKNDLDSEFDGKNITMKLVSIPKEEAVEPIIERKKKIFEPGLSIKRGFDLWILLLILLIIIISFVIYMQHRKLKKIEKRKGGQTIVKQRLRTIVKQRTNTIIRSVDNGGLRKKLDALEKSYRLGFVSKESYEKGRDRIKRKLG